MLKLTITSAPPSDWSVDEWQTHYTERHGPVVSGARAASRHIFRYTQGPTWFDGVPADLPGFDPRLACLTQVWFRDQSAMDAYYGEPAHALVRADEALFCDYDSVVLTVGEDHEILPELVRHDAKRHALRPRIHVTVFRQAIDNAERDAFRGRWLGERGPAIVGHPALVPFLRGYVQTHSVSSGFSRFPPSSRPVVDTFTMQTQADALAFWQAYSSAGDLRGAEADLVDHSGELVLFWRSHDVIVPNGEEADRERV